MNSMAMYQQVAAVTKQDDEAYPKTLYVGNLDPQVSESLIMELFSVIGPVKSCKMIQDPNGLDPYCFVEFFNHGHALAAHGAMNQRKILGKEIRVNWATRPAGKRDTSNHHHIFVGDLAPETTSEDLKNYFSKVGIVSDARVMRDLQNNKSKGYGFVSFVNYQDAQDIVEKKRIIPEALHGRQVRCNWAARKGGPTAVQRLDYNVILNQSSPTNCTVYMGGCMSGLSEQIVREAFSGFGNVLEIRVFPDKGYAFIRFDQHTDAAQAITAKHGTQLEGYTIKCSWGKEGAGLPSTMGSSAYNGMSQATMDNSMHHWSPGSDMWGINQSQQQQYSQWTNWRNPQQQQQQQQNSWNTWAPSNNQQQQSSSNTWAPSSMNSNTWGGQQQQHNQPTVAQTNAQGGGTSTWGPMSSATGTWTTNSSQQPQQAAQQQQQTAGGGVQQGGNNWGWPTATMAQQQVPTQGGGDQGAGWGATAVQQNINDQMWSNWNSQGGGNYSQQQQQPQQTGGQQQTTAAVTDVITSQQLATAVGAGGETTNQQQLNQQVTNDLKI